MKVYEGQGPIMQQPEKKVDTKGATGDDFKKILDEVSSPPGREGSITRTEYPGPPVADGVHILHGVEQMNEPLNVAGKKQVINELQKMLDLVDFYSAKLRDTTMPAQEMTPLISHLQERLESIHGMEAAPGMPEGLKPIINDMAVTISAEIAKFNRGDYS